MTRIERIECIDGLRAVADFFEQHPEIDVMPSPYLFANLYAHECDNPVAVLAAVAKAGGKVKKNYTETEFQVELHFGKFMLRYDAPRARVCERVKVGEKIIPEFTLPAREETVVPEKVEEIFEWKCPGSLLEASHG